jgi:DNA-binding transcriptional LysR family regulator
MIGSDDLRFFDVLTRAPSLVAAARLLNVTAPAVTQRLRALEQRLGAVLFDRTTRQLALTDDGALLADHATRIVADLDAAMEALRERRDMVAGPLRVAAPLGFGRRHVAPLISSFKAKYPLVQFTLQLLENPLRVTEDSWDVIVHIGTLSRLGLQMATLAPNRRLLCAAPSYLSERGWPTCPSDLLGHDCIVLRENDEDVTQWSLTRLQGRSENVRVHAALSCNDGEVAVEWALAGRGVLLRSEWDVSAHVAAGALCRILPEWQAEVAPVVALLGPRRVRTRRVRTFVDWLKRNLDPAPWASAADTIIG